MLSIKEIFKIGHGPSSSHTIGPRKAAEIFSSRNPAASSFRVTLYGSLAATGKGHLTDRTIIEALAPKKAEIIWRPDIVPDFHTNGMLFEALAEDGVTVLKSKMVYSIGGGSLSLGTQTPPEAPVQVYPHNSLNEIKKYINEEGLSFWEYVERFEEVQIRDYLGTVWNQMKSTIEEGLNDDSLLPGPIHLRSKARRYFIRAKGLTPNLRTTSLVSSYALATSEQNARGGIVVTAPTCGSCGVVPAVLYHLHMEHSFSDMVIIKALETAGLFGNIIKTNASLSGAEVGCQGEVGSACVMAAVATNQVFGGTPQQIECAAEMAMEHNLGLTCDPVCGLVQVPCIERNVVAALRALDVSLYALLGDGSTFVDFDSVVETMKRTGHDIPSPYKETSSAGLAAIVRK